ncbi:hypothetical protein JOD25_002081 [Kurthia huakuii]|uniref:DUF2975 domain-containing protein n=2 Tax=Kurthia huakuii TaxID=1421019 RepID=UPI0004B4919E|nr:DUF2975 domain-containing protein [Kurthia huakuii]MBM7699740.1 hypothetical protein [Kurthia huakuii]
MMEKKFQQFLHVLYIVVTIMWIGFCVSAFALATTFIAISFTSEESVQRFIQMGDVQAAIHFYGITLELSPQLIEQATFSKAAFLPLIGMLFIYVLIGSFIVFFVRKLLKSLKEGEIFTVKNSRFIEWIGYSFIVLSLLLKSIQALMLYGFDQMFQLTATLKHSAAIQGVSYEFFGVHWSLLFGGIILWIIGRVFKYGAFLQEEYDATV